MTSAGTSERRSPSADLFGVLNLKSFDAKPNELPTYSKCEVCVVLESEGGFD